MGISRMQASRQGKATSNIKAKKINPRQTDA